MAGYAIGFATAFIALIGQPLYQRAVTFGVTRSQSSFENVHGLQELKLIPDTVHCEDLHLHETSGLMFSACQDSHEQAYHWWPALGLFKDPTHLKQGSITVVDPSTLRVRKLKLTGFKGPFVTHGLDIYEPPNDPSTVYIYAINHLPNPGHYSPPAGITPSPNKGRSQIEVFKHKIGSTEAQFVRTVRHPLIATPNDIYATGHNSFYTTNDHFYREGALRMIEDVLNQQLAPWSDTVHVSFDDKQTKDPDAGVDVVTALVGLHNNNGLGHSKNPADVAIIDASGGVLNLATRRLDAGADPALAVHSRIQFDSTLDNPTYFFDKWATPGNNASGWVVGGLGRAVSLPTWTDPTTPQASMVWHLRNSTQGATEKRLIFADDGYKVRGAATGVLVGIDPKNNNGKKQAWLFVTGFLTKSIAATKIDL